MSKNQDKDLMFLSILFWVINFVILIIIVDFLHNSSLGMFNIFFTAWFIFFFLGCGYSLVALLAGAYKSALYINLGFLGTFAFFFFLHRLWPTLIEVILGVMVIYIIVTLWSGSVEGGMGLAFGDSKSGSSEYSEEKSRDSRSPTFEEKAETNPFAFFGHPCSHRITDTETGEEYVGFGFDAEQAKKEAQEKMEKSSRFRERNSTNPLTSKSCSYEVTDTKKGKTYTGRAKNEKKARESAWNKTRRS